jgi:hypothetical protein
MMGLKIVVSDKEYLLEIMNTFTVSTFGMLKRARQRPHRFAVSMCASTDKHSAVSLSLTAVCYAIFELR